MSERHAVIDRRRCVAGSLNPQGLTDQPPRRNGASFLQLAPPPVEPRLGSVSPFSCYWHGVHSCAGGPHVPKGPSHSLTLNDPPAPNSRPGDPRPSRPAALPAQLKTGTPCRQNSKVLSRTLLLMCMLSQHIRRTRHCARPQSHADKTSARTNFPVGNNGLGWRTIRLGGKRWR